MNIFVLDRDPRLAARAHCDTHVVKMAVETAQMLSTAHHVLESPTADHVYKPTHVNHPCNVWVRSAGGAYQWAAILLEELCREFERRRGKPHGTARLLPLLSATPMQLLAGPYQLPPHPLAMPDEFKGDCPVAAYRAFYRHAKADIARWDWLPSSRPDWWPADS